MLTALGIWSSEIDFFSRKFRALYRSGDGYERTRQHGNARFPEGSSVGFLVESSVSLGDEQGTRGFVTVSGGLNIQRNYNRGEALT